MSAVEIIPLFATMAAVPQLLPQFVRLVRSRRPDGVSPTWASLTVAGNLGWFAYFTTTGLWTAMVPSATCGLLAAAIVATLAGTGVRVRSGIAIGVAWLAVLAGALLLSGPSGLGAVLTVAFLLQVTPSLRSAWRTASPVGVSRVTWGLIGVEVLCWGTVGILDARPPLVVLGVTGTAAVAAMLWLTRAGRGKTATPVVAGAA
jgi:hypothetical protein